MSGMSEPSDPMSEAVEREPTPRAQLLMWLGLLALTALSFACSFANLGPLGIPTAMAIAIVKGTLVVLVFMELAFHRFTLRATIIVAVSLVVLLLGLMVADVVTRPALENLPP